jgi:hypothetical protein
VGRSSRILSLAIAFWGCCLSLSAQDFFTPAARHAFAQALFDIGDYAGAKREWAFLIQLPNHNLSTDSLHYRIGQCAFREHPPGSAEWLKGFESYTQISTRSPALFNHSRIAEGYKRLLFDLPNDAVVPSVLPLADSLSREHQRFQQILYPLWVIPQTYPYRKWKDYRQAFQQYHHNRTGFEPQSIVLRKAVKYTDTLVSFYERKKEKSPLLAGTLATLIPGGGKAYLGNWGQATMIFLTTSLLGLIAYEGHYRHKDWQLYTFGTLAAGYHVMSIYSATLSIRIFNRELPHNFRRALRPGVTPVLDDVLLFQ